MLYKSSFPKKLQAESAADYYEDDAHYVAYVDGDDSLQVIFLSSPKHRTTTQMVDGKSQVIYFHQTKEDVRAHIKEELKKINHSGLKGKTFVFQFNVSPNVVTHLPAHLRSKLETIPITL